MAHLIKYPETVQYRQMIQEVHRHPNKFFKGTNRPRVLKFTGTVKLHGVNAAIGYQQNIGHWCQSRNRVINIDHDNVGFASHIDRLADEFFAKYVLTKSDTIREHYERGNEIVIYGEWCGGNIQQNVALSSLLPMFVIFKIQIIQLNDHGLATVNKDPAFWLEPLQWLNIEWHELSIYNIYEFPTFEAEINMKEPELAEELLTKITEEIERKCPVAAHFNVNGAGEGVVWTEWEHSRGQLNFKVKGRAHLSSQNTSLVSTAPMKFSTVEQFLKYACTENRMRQALEYMHEDKISIELKNIDQFLRWLTEDIVKEEKDTMALSGIIAKQISRLIRSECEDWFTQRVTQNRKIQQNQKKKRGKADD